MARFAYLSLLLVLGGCAMPSTVQRIGVGYNNAVANLTDELTLKNIVRAQNKFPLHYTSISRLTGSITLKVTGGFNAAVKSSSPVDTTQTQTTASATPGVVSTITRAVTSGVNQYNPSIGGEVDTNPSFDVDVEDTKEFRQGVTTSINADTIAALLNEGYDPVQLLSLTMAHIDFKLAKKSPLFPGEVGKMVTSLSGRDAGSRADDLETIFKCYTFSTVSGPSTELAPVSRITSSSGKADGTASVGPPHLSMQDLALLDGTKLDIVGKVGKAAAGDENVMVVRPSSSKVGRLTWVGDNIPTCPKEAQDPNGGAVHAPGSPPAHRMFVGSGKVFVAAPYDSHVAVAKTGFVDVDTTIVFRSPEGLIEFLGECLGPSRSDAPMTCVVGKTVIFELFKGTGSTLDISTDFGPERYYIKHDSDNGRASLRTLGIIEKLIDLNKSSTDKPVTTPVRVVS